MAKGHPEGLPTLQRLDSRLYTAQVGQRGWPRDLGDRVDERRKASCAAHRAVWEPQSPAALGRRHLGLARQLSRSQTPWTDDLLPEPCAGWAVRAHEHAPPENGREGTRAAAQRCGWRGGRPATLGVRRHRSHVESNRSSLPVLQLPSTARESQYEARPGRTAAH